MIKGIIFDIDGTLMDTERIYHEAWMQACAERGYLLRDELFYSILGITVEATERIMQDALDWNFPYWEVRQRRVELAEKAIASDKALLKPGAMELLNLLQDKQIPFAAATSTEHDLTQAHLRAAGLDKILSKVVTGNMVTNGKPAPDIYLKAASILEIKPEHCLAVEDTKAGLASAAAAGMKTVWIPDLHSNPTPGHADCFRQYHSLEELINEIPRLIAE